MCAIGAITPVRGVERKRLRGLRQVLPYNVFAFDIVGRYFPAAGFGMAGGGVTRAPSAIRKPRWEYLSTSLGRIRFAQAATTSSSANVRNRNRISGGIRRRFFGMKFLKNAEA